MGAEIPAISLVLINYLIAEGVEISNALIFLSLAGLRGRISFLRKIGEQHTQSHFSLRWSVPP